ncbi:LytTR family transcriptional regulator DNA-binding domain-containing protein [Pseudonocardia sp. Cha107L01]|uniref:LytTR family transcriptional regulator DNA-binding domain-containing protein n=1 Tax=Pseudonocardia sp. Cha107L01 TaxID=3457576 RepID=UPI00403E6791
MPTPILLSWYRCRDVYGVDPLHTSPPAAIGLSTTAPSRHSALTQLGGIAAVLADRTDGAVTTVTDAGGRILGTWGVGVAHRRATESHLAPLFTWSESATGTNGMGTALDSAYPVSVRGPEHWCESLHDWTCHGVALVDPVKAEPIAALNISFWRQDVSPATCAHMEQAVAALRAALEQQALREGTELAKAFFEAEQAVDRRVPILAVDVGGSVVAANDRAEVLAAIPSTGPALQTRSRSRTVALSLRSVIREASTQAAVDPKWLGQCQLNLPDQHLVFEVRPILSGDELLGLLLIALDAAAGDLPPAASEATSVVRHSVIGLCDNRMIILGPSEIRYAEADQHTVWLVTDRGRLRALTRGLDNLERELQPLGFVRVHRGYLVNVRRVREVEQGLSKGTLTVSTQHHGREAIPVARRHVPSLRAALGI